MTDFNHAHNKKAEIAQQIHNSYNTTSFEKSEENNLEKSLDELEKGGKRAYIGEIRTFGGREYIRTSQGWKYHGKGTGKKAQEHKAGVTKHTKDATSAASPGSQKKDDTKHISDMTATEKKAAAKQLGIDIKGKSTAEINKELVGKNVERALQEWKDKRKETSKKPTSQQVTDAISKVGEALASKKSADIISALRDEAKRLGAAYGMSNEKIDEAISTSKKGYESEGPKELRTKKGTIVSPTAKQMHVNQHIYHGGSGGRHKVTQDDGRGEKTIIVSSKQMREWYGSDWKSKLSPLSKDNRILAKEQFQRADKAGK